MQRLPLAATSVFLLLSACATTPPEVPRATAGLEPTKGSKTFGEATFEQVGAKVKVVIFVQGLKPDQEHGLHIHEGGACGPDGMAAGGHFNPHGKAHSRHTDANRHAGDLPSLKAAKNGRARVEVELDGLSVGAGAGNVIGRTVIVHADPDDFRTQPTGNAGARIACGVIKAG